jgi:hypothetical protein
LLAVEPEAHDRVAKEEKNSEEDLVDQRGPAVVCNNLRGVGSQGPRKEVEEDGEEKMKVGAQTAAAGGLWLAHAHLRWAKAWRGERLAPWAAHGMPHEFK